MTLPAPLIDSAADDGAMARALGWIEELLTGNLATLLAVLAVAGLGLAFLQGRIAARRGAQVALGSFILFGAPVIAAALAGLAHSSGQGAALPTATPAELTAPLAPPPVPRRDPYAGASVPM